MRNRIENNRNRELCHAKFFGFDLKLQEGNVPVNQQCLKPVIFELPDLGFRNFEE